MRPVATILLAICLAAPAFAAGELEKESIRRNPTTDANTPKSAPATQKTGATATTPAARPKAGSEVLRVAGALAAIIVLILVLRWVAKKYFGVASVGRSTRAIQLLSRSPLSPRQHVMLLRVGRRVLVVADAGGQINTLSEITDADEVATLIGQVHDDHSDRASATFGNLFSKFRGKYEPDESENDDASTIGGRLSQAAGDAGYDDGHDDRPQLESPDAPGIASAKQELSGLMDKVRMLSRQFKNP